MESPVESRRGNAGDRALPWDTGADSKLLVTSTFHRGGGRPVDVGSTARLRWKIVAERLFRLKLSVPVDLLEMLCLLMVVLIAPPRANEKNQALRAATVLSASCAGAALLLAVLAQRWATWAALAISLLICL